MKFRYSLFNLLVITALLALSITVVILGRKLREERSLRTELLQKGGILEIEDIDKVHVVAVSSRYEGRTLRWRVYVPPGLTVTLNTNSKPCLPDDILQPRIRTKKVVSSARMTTDRIELPPGEHVITYKYKRPERELQPGIFSIDVRGAKNIERIFRSSYCNLGWLKSNYNDLTWLERPGGKNLRNRFRNTRASQLVDDKYFVLFRFRGYQQIKNQSDDESDNDFPEVFAWLSIEE